MASDATPPAERPRLERWARLWEVFFALTLAVPTLVTVASDPGAARTAGTVGIAAGLAAWHWVTAVRRPEWEGRAPILLWFAGLLAFTWLLLGRHDSFTFLIYGLYPQVFARLGRWAVPGVVALSVVVVSRLGILTGQPPSQWLLNIGGQVLLALLVGLFVTVLVRETTARQEALDALEATRAELAATSRRTGMLAERERLARDLHDTIAQGFTGVVMQLEAAEQALGDDPARAREHLVRARDSARDNLGEIRRAVHAVRPRALEDASPGEALDRITRRWAEATGIAATAVVEGAPRPLHPDIEVALLRTAQEGLTNVARHARADTATVRLRYHPDRVALTVTDDGTGFTPGLASGNGGAGLRGLDERLAELGGRLAVDSEAGRGTTLAAEVPT